MPFFGRKKQPAETPAPIPPAPLVAFAAAAAPAGSPLQDMTQTYISRVSGRDVGALPLPTDPFDRMIELRIRYWMKKMDQDRRDAKKNPPPHKNNPKP